MIQSCENCGKEFLLEDGEDGIVVEVPRLHRGFVRRKPERWMVCSVKCGKIVQKEQRDDLQSMMTDLVRAVRIVR